MNNEYTTIELIEDDSYLSIGETKWKCDSCNGIFIVRQGVFNYCPQCGKAIK